MAETMQEWIRDARIYAEEALDDEDFRMLDTHPKRKEVYREIAAEGRQVYNQMKDVLAEPGHEADDPMIPFDLSREAMRAALGRGMDRLFPGWLADTEEAESLDYLLEQMTEEIVE